LRFIFKGIAQGILYLHEEMNFANRDIKPDNLLFVTQKGGTNNQLEDRAQIADFTTIVECTSVVNDSHGTPAFSPPEVLNQQSAAGYLPKPVDIWAMGSSIYCLWFGHLPHKNIEDAKTKPVVIPEDPEMSKELRDALERLLAWDVADRATITQVVQLDWFK
jgi:serine/threonine protein kinase